ncbi:MAG: glycosyltransferase [Bacilli bacterium]|nr:glycosyltransferase [Bacilli bacterium]
MKSNKNNKKVSIILIHYNQKDYIKNALLSVFKQNYNNLELILADDASNDLDLEDLKKYIKKENHNNIEIKYSINEENVGTVKNINNSLKLVTGDYLLIFAADDELYNENVISKMVDFYNKQEEDVSIVFGQCLMMDNSLKETKEKFINEEKGESFNKMTSQEQYKVLAFDCFAAMGACMLDVKLLKEENGFDERFKYIEDWTYYLKTTLTDHRMKYLDYNCLLHRDGGISHSEQMTILKRDFFIDLLKKTEILIFPHLNMFNYQEKKILLKRYADDRDLLRNNGYYYDDVEYQNIKKKNITFFMKRKIEQINNESKLRIRKHINNLQICSVFVILLILLNIYLNNKYETIFNCGLVLLFIVIAYILLKILILLLIKILSKIRIIKF